MNAPDPHRVLQTAAQQDGLMRALFELSPLGLQLINLTRRRVEAVNDALVALTGYSRDELIHGDGRARFPEAMRPVRDGWFVEAEVRGRFGPSEVDYVHASGQLVRLVFNGVRITDPQHADYLWLSVQDVSAQRALEAQLRQAANTDRLTGLANRAAMLGALQALADTAAGGGTGFALMYMDFDRFKLVNDTLGHDAGDALLCAIAQRLRDAAKPGWTVSRLGGDEFVLLAPGLDEALARACADALLASLSAPYRVGGQAVDSSASIGIALWRDGAGGAEALLREADLAMYEAKRRGRGRWVMVDDGLRARLQRRLRIEQDLRLAIAQGTLDLQAQPVVDLASAASVAWQLLPRWQHPDLGEVPREEFLAVADESRQAVALGDWLLRRACLQWRDWQGGASPPARVCVALSRAQLAAGVADLPQRVAAALAAARMPAQALQLDLAERDVMGEPAAVAPLLQALSALGVRLALYGFGAAHSSLRGLRHLPLQEVRIDPGFVAGLAHDAHALAVAHATVNLIENLGMTSVAEGITQADEVATLLGLGCRHGQGPLFNAGFEPPPRPA